MVEVFFASIVFLWTGYWLGVIRERKARPRHDHYFEVIEKKELPSAFEESGHTAIGQLLEANKYVNPGWQPNTDVILRLTKHKTLVHYRCNTCGAEKVEKI